MEANDDSVDNFSSVFGNFRPSDYHNLSFFEFESTPKLPHVRLASLLICVFFTVFVIPLGIIHNYLVYLTAKSMPVQTSTTILFSYLAIVDIFCLLERLVLTMSLRVLIIIFDVSIWTEINCKIFGIITYLCTFMSAYTTLGVSIDRALSIKFFNWHQKLNQKLTAVLIIVICFCLTFLTNVHTVVSEVALPANDIQVCIISPRKLKIDVILWVFGGLYALVSSFLMALANAIFIQTLVVQKRRASVRYSSGRKLRNRKYEGSQLMNGSLTKADVQNGKEVRRTKSSEIPTQQETNLKGVNETTDEDDQKIITLKVPGVKKEVSRTVSNTLVECRHYNANAELIIEKRNRRRVKKDRTYVTMVILFTISYFILSSATVGSTIYATLSLNPDDPKEAPVYELCFVLCFVFSTLNILSNAIFFFSSSEAFREQARQVLRRENICSKLATLGLL